MTKNSRRNFLSVLGAASAGAVIAPNLKAFAIDRISDAVGESSSELVEDLARNESFWTEIRRAFDLPNGVVNLDNGYCNPLSREATSDLVEKTRYLQQLPGKRLEELFAEVTEKQVLPGVARLLGVPADEVALVRNATEALDSVILGLPMKAGDEIVCSAHDYYAMLDAIEQREKRDGIVIKMIRPQIPAGSMDSLVEQYRKAFSPKTKLVLVTHASNTTGQIYPVKSIAVAAHRVGAEVLVDGAQTMALLDYKIPDLDCDYYGASLHKWLMAPVGSGVLWMRKRHVQKVWPLVPPPRYIEGMKRYMWSGTYPEFISASAARALIFHEKLGAARKEARIRYLTSYWREKVSKLAGVRFYTTADREMSCGLGIFEIESVDSNKLQKDLWNRHKVLVQYMDGGKRAPELKGIRVTPNVYTTTIELDRFSDLVAQAVKRKH